MFSLTRVHNSSIRVYLCAFKLFRYFFFCVELSNRVSCSSGSSRFVCFCESTCSRWVFIFASSGRSWTSDSSSLSVAIPQIGVWVVVVADFFFFLLRSYYFELKCKVRQIALFCSDYYQSFKLFILNLLVRFFYMIDWLKFRLNCVIRWWWWCCWQTFQQSHFILVPTRNLFQ